MTLYSIDVKVYATAYIKADSAEEALEIAKTMKGDALELQEQDGETPIYGGKFSSPDMPDVSLSPAMTIHGPDDSDVPAIAEDDDDDEDDEDEDEPADEED